MEAGLQRQFDMDCDGGSQAKNLSGIYMAISEPGLPGTQAAFQMDWCDAKSPWAPVTTAVLVGWQRSQTWPVSSILGVWFLCIGGCFLLTIVCAETSLPSFQSFLLCDKLSGRLFENWSLILSQTYWCYNVVLFQTGTKQILDSAISVQNSTLFSEWF